jgi:hypothetical protein
VNQRASAISLRSTLISALSAWAKQPIISSVPVYHRVCRVCRVVCAVCAVSCVPCVPCRVSCVSCVCRVVCVVCVVCVVRILALCVQCECGVRCKRAYRRAMAGWQSTRPCPPRSRSPPTPPGAPPPQSSRPDPCIRAPIRLINHTAHAAHAPPHTHAAHAHKTRTYMKPARQDHMLVRPEMRFCVPRRHCRPSGWITSMITTGLVRGYSRLPQPLGPPSPQPPKINY